MPAKPKPSEVAAETRRNYLPHIIQMEAMTRPTYSYLFRSPLTQVTLNNPTTRHSAPVPPNFTITSCDPADFAINWKNSCGSPIPFICGANDKRPGGDWETGVVGYEERLCRRSTLSANLATPGPGSVETCNYPIPSEGAIFNQYVIVFRGPHEKYEKLPQEQWYDLPVVSIPAARWPKLRDNGTKFAFPMEMEMVRNKMRAALRICLYYGYHDIVIGDFGLGNGLRNPPLQLAELWRDVFLYDSELRGQFQQVAFVFEEPNQSTTKNILDDIAKKSKSKTSSSASKSGSSSSKSSSSHHASSSSSSSAHQDCPSDYEVFTHVFHPAEVQRVLTQSDPRCKITYIR